MLRYVFFLLATLPSLVYAQNIVVNTAAAGPASSFEEGVLRGLSLTWVGKGEYLKGLGRYERDHQMAVQAAMENRDFYIRSYWQLLDDRSQRYRRVYEKYTPTARSAELDRLEQLHTIKERENSLREKGVLPPLRTKQIFVNGRSYDSYEQFKRSISRSDLKQEALQNALNHLLQQKQRDVEHQELVQKLRDRCSMSVAEQDAWDRKMKNHRLFQKLMGAVPNLIR